MRDVLVIGGGIHGVTTALSLAARGFNVELAEKRQGLLLGTSRSTHNRAHMGYHYPRCLATTQECLTGLSYFKQHYPEALYYHKENYYMIEKHNSHVSTEEYKRFCDTADIPYTESWPDSTILNRTHIDSCFQVPEPNFNLPVLRSILLKKLVDAEISIHLDTEIIEGVKSRNNRFIALTNKGHQLTSDIVINASYADTNSILQRFGVNDELTEYYLQHTEIVVAETSRDIPALTVMDGPFISVMPYVGHPNQVLVYDVIHSVVQQDINHNLADFSPQSSNWDKMLEHGLKYYPFLSELRYVKSLYGSRPIRVKERKDGRKTRLTTYPSVEGLYSIQEGKFISAPIVAEQLADKIVHDLDSQKISNRYFESI